MTQTVGSQYWIPHKQFLWAPARLTSCTGSQWTFTLDDGETVQVPVAAAKKFELVAPTSLNDGVSNLVELEDFNDATLLFQLRRRYLQQEIYTGIGSIIVAINPYQVLPLYSRRHIDLYRNALNISSMPPHVFQVSAQAYSNLMESSGSTQAVLISGESGAGKTETTKSVLQYISEVAGSDTGVEQEILLSNPVMEAFGNAKTLRNHNSSRFGKWMEIHFATTGRVMSARVVPYLLEKARVTNLMEQERNFHIFYQICKGLPSAIKTAMKLGAATQYRYLNMSGTTAIPRLDDAKQLTHTMEAMTRFGFEKKELLELWQILSSILHLGNVTFVAKKYKGQDGTEIKEPMKLKTAADVFKCNLAALKNALIFKTVTIRGSVSMIPQNVELAENSRDSLAKAIYTHVFDWLLARINLTLSKNGSTNYRIGILDIFGFEMFEHNGFEQFCINYANEKLQQYFINHIFKLEQQEYRQEGVPVSHIDFHDNMPCINLIEQKREPLGLIKLMDEEVVLPKGSDSALVDKMHALHARHPNYLMDRKAPQAFIIRHYAGKVMYSSAGFVARNRDQTAIDESLILSSSIPLLKTIFGADKAKAEAEEDLPMTRGRGGGRPKKSKKQKKKTLATQFADQLSSLLKALHSAEPHYIRCIKPNANKEAFVLESKMVFEQLKYAGIAEALKIRQAGFSWRSVHQEFVKRFRICLQGTQFQALDALQGKAQVDFLLSNLGEQLDSTKIAIGKTKVFLKGPLMGTLIQLRKVAMTVYVLKLQALSRGHAARQKFKQLTAMVGDAKEAMEKRDAELLEEMLDLLDENGYDELRIFREIKLVHDYVLGEVQALGLLAEALEKKERRPLEAALEQAGKLLAKFPSMAAGPKLVQAMDQAKAMRELLVRKQKAKDALQTAMRRTEIAPLEAALKEAAAVGLDNLEAARTLLKKLVDEEERVQALRDAVATGDLAQIEAALDAVADVPLDALRKTDINGARKMLQQGYKDLAQVAMKAEDIQKLTEILIKVRQKQWKKVEEWIEGYMTEWQKRKEIAAKEAEDAAAAKLKAAQEAVAAEKAVRDAAAPKVPKRKSVKPRPPPTPKAKPPPRPPTIPDLDTAPDAPPSDEEDEFDSDDEAPPPPGYFALSPTPATEALAEAEKSIEHARAVTKAVNDVQTFRSMTLLPPPPAPDGDEPPPGPPDDLSMFLSLLPPPPEEDDDTFIPPPPPPPEEDDLLFPPPPPEEEDRDMQLQLAIENEDVEALKALLSSLGDETPSRLELIAQTTITACETHGEFFARIVKAQAEFDEGQLFVLLAEAEKAGLSTKNVVVQANEFVANFPKCVRLAKQINAALLVRDHDLIRSLVDDARPLGKRLEYKETPEADFFRVALSEARHFLTVEDPRQLAWISIQDKNRRKWLDQGTDDEEHYKERKRLQGKYATFLALSGTCPLDEFEPLRREGNYAKRKYFQKKGVKAGRLKWQKTNIPRSLIKLSTEYCRTKEKSKEVKGKAKPMFDDLRKIMGDTFHPYPDTIAYEVIKMCWEEPLLRDEIYCQSIKQTSDNPSMSSVKRGLCFLLLCLSTFSPSRDLRKIVFAHIAQWAHVGYAGQVIGLGVVPDIATNAFLSALNDREVAGSHPTLEDIQAVSNGEYPVPAGETKPSMGGARAQLTRNWSSPNFDYDYDEEELADDDDDPPPPAPMDDDDDEGEEPPPPPAPFSDDDEEDEDAPPPPPAPDADADDDDDLPATPTEVDDLPPAPETDALLLPPPPGLQNEKPFKAKLVAPRGRQVTLPPAPPPSMMTAPTPSLPPISDTEEDVGKANDPFAARAGAWKTPAKPTKNAKSDGASSTKFAGGPPGSDKFAGGPPGSNKFAGGPPGSSKFAGGPPGSDKLAGGPPGSTKFAGGPPGSAKFAGGPPGSDKFVGGPPGSAKFQGGPPGAASAPPTSKSTRVKPWKTTPKPTATTPSHDKPPPPPPGMDDDEDDAPPLPDEEAPPDDDVPPDDELPPDAPAPDIPDDDAPPPPRASESSLGLPPPPDFPDDDDVPDLPDLPF